MDEMNRVTLEALRKMENRRGKDLPRNSMTFLEWLFGWFGISKNETGPEELPMEWGVFETVTQVHVVPYKVNVDGDRFEPHKLSSDCYCGVLVKRGKLREVIIHKVALTNQVPSSDNKVQPTTGKEKNYAR